ncbi:MAG TPA: TVP38/TMEM64 family protein [Spirochaetia bacterium]|nr:TVP38/TMEM64 family protein [Spirochaetia bacterium]
MKTGARKVLALIAFPVLLAAVTVPVLVWHDAVWKLFSSRALLRDWVAGWGPWAPLAFVGLQTFHVIVFVLPGEVVQIAGGYLFGVWKGTLLAIVGTLPGAAVDFGLARALGRPFVASLFSTERVQSIEKLLSSRSAKIVFFLLFLIPGIPKDILCYVAGITPMRLVFFLVISTLGRIPGILGSSLIGHAAASERWLLTGIVSASAIVFFAAGLILRPHIQRWVEGIVERRK